MLCRRYITVKAVRGGLVAQRECVARDHLGHRPPGVGRVFSKFVLGSSDGKGGVTLQYVLSTYCRSLRPFHS